MSTLALPLITLAAICLLRLLWELGAHILLAYLLLWAEALADER